MIDGSCYDKTLLGNKEERKKKKEEKEQYRGLPKDKSGLEICIEDLDQGKLFKLIVKLKRGKKQTQTGHKINKHLLSRKRRVDP